MAEDGTLQFRAHQPEITLVDLRLPDMSGIDVLRTVRKEFPEGRFIMLTIFDCGMEIQRAPSAGAHVWEK